MNYLEFRPVALQDYNGMATLKECQRREYQN